jgi:predicted ATP-grasp superfamily ATP-dependent carboligase
MEWNSKVKIKFKSPALILAGLGTGGYGIMRSLGREGVPVVGIIDRRDDPGRFSRYCRRCYFYSGGSLGGSYSYSAILAEDPALCRLLLQRRADFEYNPVLFATGDPFALLLAGFREELAPYYEFHWVPQDKLSRIINKDQMSILCREADILIPKTHITSAQEDLTKSAHDFSFPCIVKPTCKSIADFPPDRKNFVADSPHALIDFYRRYPGLRGSTIWQEIIEGGDENNFVCAVMVQNSGDPAAIFCTRKLRQYPPYGVMSYGRSEQNEVVMAEALRLVRFLGYRGVASIEFKYQPKDGRYYFLEMNPRWPRYNGYFADAGLNLPYMAYLDLAGIADDRTFPVHQQNGVYWICALDDWKLHWERRERGRHPLWQWFRSVVEADSYAFWCWRDPIPFLVSSLHLLSAGVRKLARILWKVSRRTRHIDAISHWQQR